SMPSIARVSVFRTDGSGENLVLTHQWVAPGTEGRPLGLVLPVAGSAALERLAGLQELYLDLDVDQRERTADVDAYLDEYRLRSVLSVPLAEDGNFAGFISFSSVLTGVLPDSTYSSMLRAAAGIVGGAFARHEAEQRLAYQATVDGLTGLANRWSFMD